MKINEFYKKIEELVPSGLSCDWDNDGLMCCSDTEREIKKVLLTLDVTEATAEYAVKNSFDLIMSHHPMIFKPLPSVSSKKIVKLIRSGISVISLHTRLDKVDGGVNSVLAELLGLSDTKIFSEEGVGLIGELSCEISALDFAKKVKNILGAPFAEVVYGGVPCKRIAVCGGDGKDCLSDALKAGCDTYVTGSMSYNSMTDASELSVNIIAAGHYFTENPVLEALSGFVKAIDPSVYTEKFNCNLIETV